MRQFEIGQEAFLCSPYGVISGTVCRTYKPPRGLPHVVIDVYEDDIYQSDFFIKDSFVQRGGLRTSHEDEEGKEYADNYDVIVDRAFGTFAEARRFYAREYKEWIGRKRLEKMQFFNLSDFYTPQLSQDTHDSNVVEFCDRLVTLGLGFEIVEEKFYDDTAWDADRHITRIKVKGYRITKDTFPLDTLRFAYVDNEHNTIRIDTTVYRPTK